ncbi:hypothetical protein CHUAL_007023 [Chamberlinius hualienensis]
MCWFSTISSLVCIGLFIGFVYLITRTRQFAHYRQRLSNIHGPQQQRPSLFSHILITIRRNFNSNDDEHND